MSTTLNWGILGAGGIANTFANGVKQSKTGKLVAVGSRTQEKADAFGEKHNIAKRHGSYEALLADRDVQAVYIATPHPMHARGAIATAKAGKHILCEKPIALNYGETMAIVEAARENDVFLMEAYMYRCCPQTKRLVELIGEKAIGDVRMIVASFGFHAGFNPEGRLFKNELGGGGILDVGGYPVSAARLIAGVAMGQPFANPTEVKAVGVLGQTGVDEWTAAVLKFPGSIVAQVSTGVSLNMENGLHVYGSTGSIHLKDPWIPAREGGATVIRVKRNGKPEEEIRIETTEYLYGMEADTVAKFLQKREAESPAMSIDDTLGNARVLDQWRAQIGLQYELEKPGKVRTVTQAPLHVAKPTKMKYGQLPGLDKPVSRLIMGCDNQPDLPYAAAMFDDWFERGGNTFDTAYVYGGGSQERLLGQWIKTRDVRPQVNVIVKGVHSPYCFPNMIGVQLDESLGRLGIDSADIYIMHRDNTDVPVGEFVDALNELVEQGRIKVFGGSNWTLARFRAAQEYAEKNHRRKFAVLNNNFALARMIKPIWGGCVGSNELETMHYLAQTQTALLSWSSQARGFFLPGRAAPDKREDAELVNTWYSDDNFERLRRVNELAARRNISPINIALAWVLTQTFPTFALIGPRTLAETRTSLPALEVMLGPDEVKWLNLEK